MTKVINLQEKAESIKEQRKNQKPTVFHHGKIIYKNEERKVTACGVIYSDSENKLHMKIGMSICSLNDQFSRKIGRSKSRVKAHQKPVDCIEINSVNESQHSLYQWFINNNNVIIEE